MYNNIHIYLKLAIITITPGFTHHITSLHKELFNNRLIIMYFIFITKYTEYENANTVSQNGFSRFRQTFQ
jgi:hypothetical protein